MGSVDHRSEIHFFAETLSHLFEPSPQVHAVNDAPQKAQAFPDVIPIAPNIFFGEFCIYDQKTFHGSRFSKNLGRMA
jgi:hypothetical protein